MLRFIFYIVVFLTLFISGTSLHAQDQTGVEKITIHSPGGINLRLDYRSIPAPNNFVGAVSFKRYAPGEILINYRGIQGLIVKRAQSQYNRLWDRQMTASSCFSPDHLDKLTREHYEEWQDFNNGKWWTRTWDQARTTENGGAGETLICNEGCLVTVFSIAGISLSNEGKITTGDIRFIFDAYKPSDAETVPQVKRTQLLGGFKVDSLVKTDRYDLTFRPSISLRGTPIPGKILSSLALDLRLRLLNPGKAWAIAIITISLESNPVERRYGVMFGIDIGFW